MWENDAYVKLMVKTRKTLKCSEIQEDKFYEWNNFLPHRSEKPKKLAKLGGWQLK